MMSPSGIEIDYKQLGFEHGKIGHDLQHTLPQEAWDSYAEGHKQATGAKHGAQVKPKPVSILDVNDMFDNEFGVM